jgi:hypothetical protein
MNDDRAFERATRDWLEDGSDKTPSATIDAVLLAVRTTPQERDLRIPWRTPIMTTPMRLAAAIAIVAVVGFAGLTFFRGGASVGGPTPTPSCTSAPAPSAAQPPAPTPFDRGTWTTYTSSRYGFSICHPATWIELPSDHDWALPADASWANTAFDRFDAPDGSIAIAAWSVAVEPGTSADAWIQVNCPKYDSTCDGYQDRATPVSVDGHAGILVSFAEDMQAFILVDNRMYIVASLRPAGQYDALRLINAYISTMHLLPGGPVPAGTTAPTAASPGPS